MTILNVYSFENITYKKNIFLFVRYKEKHVTFSTFSRCVAGRAMFDLFWRVRYLRILSMRQKEIWASVSLEAARVSLAGKPRLKKVAFGKKIDIFFINIQRYIEYIQIYICRQIYLFDYIHSYNTNNNLTQITLRYYIITQIA